MGIRVKILLGFFILAFMLFISGAISIFELTKLSKAVKMMINDSYRSIDYSKQMLDAIERQERLILFHLGTEQAESKVCFDNIAGEFKMNLDSARANLTFKDEVVLIDSIAINYTLFEISALNYLEGGHKQLGDYLNEVYPLMLVTSDQIKKLMVLNQRELYESAAFHESSAQRAIMPGLIVILTSLLFTFVFTYLIHHYFVSPIIALTKGINDYVKYRKPFKVTLETKDELWSLKESIFNLIDASKQE